MDNIITAHKQIEQTLRHLTIIAEQAGEGIAILDLDGNVRFVNPAWVMIHGYNTTDELVGKQITIFHTEEQMKTDVIPFIEEAKQRGRFAGPIEHIRQDGTAFPTETKMTVVKDQADEPIGLIVFATDTTERKQAEDELKQYRHQLEQQVKQQTAELTADNERLLHEVAELRRAEDEAKQHRDQLEQRLEKLTAELTQAGEKLQHEITERKQAEDEFKQYRDKLQQRVKQQTAELTAANEGLLQEIAEYRRAEDQAKQHRDRLEQRVERLTAQLTEVNEKLRQEVTEPEMSQEPLLEGIIDAE